MDKQIKSQIISIIAKLDNGSHSANQLQGADEALVELFENTIKDLTAECVERNPSPIKDLVPALLTDAGYRYGWQANIAMAFVDAVDGARKHKPYLSRADIHKIANGAADNFLTLLCSGKSED